MSDMIAEFASQVGVMKPNTVKKTDTKGLAKLETIIDSAEYAADEKLDGCHYKLIGNRIFSTANVEKTHNFPHIVKFFEDLRMPNLILDGEMYYPGKTSQYATQVTGSSPARAVEFQEKHGYIHFAIFDIIRTPKSKWLINNTFKERRKMLQYFYDTFVKGTPMEQYIYIPRMAVEGKRKFIEDILASGGEGAVLKKLDGLYVMGKKPMWNWMKIKQEDEIDLVIMGFEEPTKVYDGQNLSSWQYWESSEDGTQIPVTKNYYMGWIGKVVLGAYVDGVLTQICTASGMKESERADMTANPDNYIGQVAKVTFMEYTTDGYPRHPSFKCMHEGKVATECTWEF